MKKSIKYIIFAATVLALSCTFAATGCIKNPSANEGGNGEASNWQDNMHREENDFLQDDNRRPSREPFVDNTPEEEEGATLTTYRFEGEHAKIRGTSNGKDHFCVGQSIEFSPSFSGNVTLGNMGTATMSYTFNSDKAVRSTMLLRIANRYGELKSNILSSHANITVNGKSVVDLSKTFDPDSGEVASGSNSMYYKMITVETKISIAKGKNVLDISSATSNYLNLDYFEILTSADIEDNTVSTITDPSSFVNVTKTPTETAGGTIAFDCHAMTVKDGKEVECDVKKARARKLPALTDPIYTKQTLDNSINHTAKMFGEDVVIASTALWELTLENATLADGSSTGRFEEGSTPELKYTLPENTEFSHWADAEGHNLGTDFTMPNKDITIHPVFVNVYTLTLEGGATLAGGVTSGTFREGAKPEIIYTTPDGQIFSHWADSSGNNLGETFTMPDKDITIHPVFNNLNNVTVTLDGATLDGKDTISIMGGSTLDLSGAVFTEQPADTVLYYWYNANNPKQYFEDASAINIPNEDITLAPAFDLAAYANKDGSTTGRLSIFPRNGYAEMLPGSGVTQPEGGYVRNIDAKGVKAGEQSAYWGLVNGTMGAVYHWTAAEGAENLNGFNFTALSPYKVNGANKYVISTTIENQGDSAINLKIYQTDSSGNFKPDATASEEFTLQKNENRTVDITFTKFDNKNIMTTVEVLSDVTDLKIGMYQSIVKVSHTLTLGEGATFENGESSATVAVGDQPKFIYNEPDHKAFSHWEDAEKNALELPFVMPDNDFAIYPVFIDSTDVEITLQGATFNGSSTINTVAKRVLDLSQAVITGGVPEGKVLKGWYDVSDRTKVYSVSFTVPEGETLTLAPVFDSDKIFYSDKTYAGKIEATGNLYGNKEKGCYSLIDNKTTGAINSGNGYYETGSIYRFKGGTAAAPAEKMAVGSYFLAQEMNGKTGSKDKQPLTEPLTVTTTVENFGSEDVTLRFAFVTGSSDPNSQFGEKTVTIKAGESSTFTFDITMLHGSFMLNVMVKDTEVSEVYIGVYQYVSAKV